MSEKFTEKELMKFLKMMKENKPKKRLLRFHIYGVIDQYPEDSSSIGDVVSYIQGYGSAEVIQVEVVDDEKG